MLKVLFDLEKQLPALLEKPGWNSLMIDYETPHVQRLWRRVGDYRLCLHRISPCETALYHPHPWPSAVRILSGDYEMGVGMVVPGEAELTEITKGVLTEGTSYEMLHPMGWHYVKPLKIASYSIMVMGPPYPPRPDIVHPKPSAPLSPLSEEVQQELLEIFNDLLS